MQDIIYDSANITVRHTAPDHTLYLQS